MTLYLLVSTSKNFYQIQIMYILLRSYLSSLNDVIFTKLYIADSSVSAKKEEPRLTAVPDDSLYLQDLSLPHELDPDSAEYIPPATAEAAPTEILAPGMSPRPICTRIR